MVMTDPFPQVEDIEPCELSTLVQGEDGVAMERLLDGAAAPRSLVLRPPAVYGPGDTEIAPLFAAMRRGVAVTPGRTNARFSMLHVQDLAEAVCAWVEQGLAADGEGRGVREGDRGLRVLEVVARDDGVVADGLTRGQDTSA